YSPVVLSTLDQSCPCHYVVGQSIHKLSDIWFHPPTTTRKILASRKSLPHSWAKPHREIVATLEPVPSDQNQSQQNLDRTALGRDPIAFLYQAPPVHSDKPTNLLALAVPPYQSNVEHQLFHDWFRPPGHQKFRLYIVSPSSKYSQPPFGLCFH